MSPDEIVIPAPIQSVYWHQMMNGEFLDVIFDCPYELQELVCDSSISQILSELSEKHKALFYFLYIRDYSTCCLANGVLNSYQKCMSSLTGISAR